jgi:hypothetical protein
MGSQMGSHRGFPPYHIVFIYCSQVPEEFAAFPRAGGSQKAAPPRTRCGYRRGATKTEKIKIAIS